jgi:hypothetical protein
MERALRSRDRGQVVVWDKDGDEAAWAAHLPPVPAVSASVPVVDTGRRTQRASHVTREAVRRAAAR